MMAHEAGQGDGGAGPASGPPRPCPAAADTDPTDAWDVATYDGDVAAMRELIVDKIAQKFEGGSAAALDEMGNLESSLT